MIWITAVVGLVIVAVFSASVFFSSPASYAKSNARVEVQSSKPALTVTMVRPNQEKWPQVISASGSIAPWQEVVVASETGGLRITGIYADVGSKVQRGQKLAQLAQDLVVVDIEQQQARVSQAKAELAEAKANAQRARNLEGRSALSDQKINQYLIGKDKAQANLEAATAQLKSQKIRLEQTNIVAVDDGVISSRSATLGSVVQVGTELFRLVRQNRIEWRAEVVADQVFNINSGQEAHIHLTSGESIVGKVRVTAPTFDTKTRKTLVYVDLPADTSARVGMFARGDILVGTNEVMTLPQSAVVLRDGYSYVFEIGSNQRVVQNKIVTGRRVDNRVEIVSGLNQNMSVVAGGGAFLNDGDTVYIADVATDSSLQVTE
jgi:RND family efflux transporter MFP subunit